MKKIIHQPYKYTKDGKWRIEVFVYYIESHTAETKEEAKELYEKLKREEEI